MLSFIFTFLTTLTLCIISPSTSSQTEPVNAVLGDLSWLLTRGGFPDSSATEQERLVVHLQWIENYLRTTTSSHLTPAQHANRLNLLDELATYRQARQFPQRVDSEPGRRPVFIDSEGRLCAVGHLIAASKGPDAARAIDATHHFDHVLTMRDERVSSWAGWAGFTLTELAMIQPAYAPCVTALKATQDQGFYTTTSMDYPEIAQRRTRGWTWRRKAPEVFDLLLDVAGALDYELNTEDVAGLHRVASGFEPYRIQGRRSCQHRKTVWSPAPQQVWITRVQADLSSINRSNTLKLWTWEFADEEESLSAWCTLQKVSRQEGRNLSTFSKTPELTLFLDLIKGSETHDIERPTLLRHGKHLVSASSTSHKRTRAYLTHLSRLDGFESHEALTPLCAKR